MKVSTGAITTWIGGAFLAVMVLLLPGYALAQCCAPPAPPPPCCAPPPTCCTPPSPPNPPPNNCCSPSHSVIVPGVNVFVAPSVNVNVRASAQAGASAGAGAAVFVGGGGGGGGGFFAPSATGVIQGLDVVGAMRARQVAYQAQRSKYVRIVIQAFCLDDRDVPHPASQVSADREIDDAYDGELYRCLAGTRMQYVYSEFSGKVDFSGGRTTVCGKGEALYHVPGGPPGAQGERGGAQLACRPQKPARDCNERSLLRRYGAGIKVLTIMITETYTAYREEMYREQSSSMTSMSLDGGVGGIVY